MPMTVLESMANSRPVICTDVGGVSQFVSNREVYLTPTKDVEALSNKMLALATEEKAISDKVSVAHQLVKEHYSIEKMVADYMGKYRIPAKVHNEVPNI